MAKWQDQIIDKPKEPFKQKLPFVHRYNDYGFDYNNQMYSITEENRDFRKKSGKNADRFRHGNWHCSRASEQDI